MSYAIYLAESLGGENSDHHAIPVEPIATSTLDTYMTTTTPSTITPTATIHPPPTRFLYQVKGSIAQGMTYEFREARPEDSYLGKTLLGTVDADDFNCIDRVCLSTPAPKKQFNGPKRLYPREKLYKCQAWTRDVLGKLEAERVLRSLHGVSWRGIHETRRTETWSV